LIIAYRQAFIFPYQNIENAYYFGIMFLVMGMDINKWQSAHHFFLDKIMKTKKPCKS
jgi:hypothetical protein